MTEALSPVVDDMGIFLIAGRTRNPGIAIDQGIEAERLGFRRVWLSERYDLKDAGALLGGVSATTTRLEVGTGVIAVNSRHPLLTASLAATMQTMYGGRFTLGLGRSSNQYLKGQGIAEASLQALEDYIGILRRLFAGESVSYDGPAGSFASIKTADPIPVDPPEIWSVILGLPKAAKLAARAADGVMLAPFLTPDAVHTAVTTIREERERLGLDPGIRICHPIVVAAEMDEIETTALTKARLITYVAGMPVFAGAYEKLNGWSHAVMDSIQRHPQFSGMARANADQVFHRHELLDPAALVPDAWMRESCAIGSARECADQLRAFRDAGADEIAVYGSTPADNAGVIDAWRARRPETAASAGHA